MGEKTASQVQDVVVAGSQSSNFLLPKENKRLSAGPPPTPLTMVGPCSSSGQTKPAEVAALSAALWGHGPVGRVGCCLNTHTHTCSELRSCVTVHLTSLGPRRSCRRWTESPEPPQPLPLTASIRVYFCISANSSQNKPSPIVMTALISAV